MVAEFELFIQLSNRASNRAARLSKYTWAAMHKAHAGHHGRLSRSFRGRAYRRKNPPEQF